MIAPYGLRSLMAAMVVAGCAAGSAAHAVRVNADGHGQALLYPYYTVRAVEVAHEGASVNTYATALSVTNLTDSPKAVKARFFEGKGGAEVYALNLFLGAYDVWTAGIIPADAGAGLFTVDHSCTTPAISSTSASPTLFRNTAYLGDPLGDTLDRTREGYFEFLEMGTIDPASPLGENVTPVTNLSSPNASKPPCISLPITDALPAGLSKPSGGLVGNVSYLNVNEGTDYSVDAIALSQWSDTVQWSGPANAHPDLGDANPPASFVVDTQADRDTLYVTRWTTGRDAVSALFMVDHVVNDFNAERLLGAATQWVLTMPTKRFHVSMVAAERPFQSVLGSQGSCDAVGETRSASGLTPAWFDREGLGAPGGLCLDCPPGAPLCASANVATFAYQSTLSRPLGSRNQVPVNLAGTFINGYANLEIPPTSDGRHRMVSPAGATSVVPLDGSPPRTGATVTYFGLPVVGFAVESYSNGSLRVGQSTVLSNYGGQFIHKYGRRIETAP